MGDQDRLALLSLIYDNCAFEICFLEFAFSAVDWVLEPLYRSDELAGVVLSKGAEVHVVLDAKYQRSSIRRAIRIANRILEQHGFLLTTTISEKNRKFAERLGFVLIREEDGVSYLRAERLNYVHTDKIAD